MNQSVSKGFWTFLKFEKLGPKVGGGRSWEMRCHNTDLLCLLYFYIYLHILLKLYVKLLMLFILFEVHMQPIFYVYTIFMFDSDTSSMMFSDSPFCVGRQQKRRQTHLKGWCCLDFSMISKLRQKNKALQTEEHWKAMLLDAQRENKKRLMSMKRQVDEKAGETTCI